MLACTDIIYNKVLFVVSGVIVPARYRLLSLICALALSACGGGSGTSSTSGNTTGGNSAAPLTVSVPAELTVTSGDPLTFLGQASSTAGAITKMQWQTEPLTLAANPLASVGNTDCKTFTSSNNGNDANCTLRVTPPAKLTADYWYKLTFTATDVRGNTKSASTTLIVKQDASVTNNPVVKTTGEITATSGDKVTLTCNASGGTPADGDFPYSFQWVVTDAKGTTIKFANSEVANTTFIAPVVTESTTIKLQCRATDDKQKVGTSTQSVVVNPIIKPTVVPLSYSGGLVTAGSTITLDGSKSLKFDANGKIIDGGQIFYLWTQKSGPSVQIFNPSAAVATVSLPKFLSSRTAFEFTLSASNSVILPNGSSVDPVKSMDIVFFADPLPTIGLVSYTPIQSVISGNAVTLKADAPGNTGSGTIFYSWTQVSGPSVVLAASNTANAGFIAPTVSTSTLLVFRVVASYQAITTANPGSASLDVIVQVNPIPTTP